MKKHPLERLIRFLPAEELKENERRLIAREKFIKLPISEWPAFEVAWDLDPAHFFYALDITEHEFFEESYSGGLKLVENIDLSKMDACLTRHWHQTIDEFWEVGRAPTKASIILDFFEKRKLTPPFIMLTEDRSSLVIGGGNHRLAVARAKKVLSVPILVRPEEAARIVSLIG